MDEHGGMRSRRVSIGQVVQVRDEPVVVIDILRAFTIAPWVLEGGASTLLLAASPVDALAMKSGLARRHSSCAPAS
jgi:phosphosulfolactate phosphohydrolase-like enzyme